MLHKLFNLTFNVNLSQNYNRSCLIHPAEMSLKKSMYVITPNNYDSSSNQPLLSY